MDRRLISAAQTGNVELLLNLIADDPLLLYKVTFSGQDTPLHIASLVGHLNFVRELLKLRKEFVYDLNQDEISPLHIASANGYIEIVKELLTIDRNLCLLRGRERRVPLHYAAVKGRTYVIQELLVSSPNSVEEVTARGESALHLWVRNSQFEAVVILVNHLKEFRKEQVLNKQDKQGNTILHLAVSRKQYEANNKQVVDLLLGRNSTFRESIEVNSLNENGLTPMDTLLLLQSEAGDREIEEILRQAGATSTIRENTTISNPLNQPERATSPATRLIEYFTFNRARDSPSEVRNTLLVIAGLIVTATYQGVLQPPGGIWQEDCSSRNGTTNHIAGKSVMGDKLVGSYGMFLLFNSIGFFASLLMINTLTAGFPLQLELQIAMTALIVTYDTSMFAISPNGVLSTFFSIISVAVPVLLSILWLVRNCLKRTRNTSDLPRV